LQSEIFLGIIKAQSTPNRKLDKSTKNPKFGVFIMKKWTKNSILVLTPLLLLLGSGLNARTRYGVLPWSVHPKTNKAIFLVGVNPSSNSSEDFGGYANKNESGKNKPQLVSST